MSSHLEFYALKRPPFDVRPGAGPVLATRPLRDTLDWVVRRIEADVPVLCITGAAGIGRSSVARVLPGRLASHCRVARLKDPRRSWPELRLSIADQLVLDQGLCRDSLLAARSQGDRVVLVVDAAERAPVELLAHLDELLDLRGPARERLVQAVVFARTVGESDPVSAPVWKWLVERRAHCREHGPLSPSEIHGYVRKRIERAGCRVPLFSETACLVVHRHTRGVPRRVNEVCDALLREGERHGVRHIDASTAARAVAGWRALR